RFFVRAVRLSPRRSTTAGVEVAGPSRARARVPSCSRRPPALLRPALVTLTRRIAHAHHQRSQQAETVAPRARVYHRGRRIPEPRRQPAAAAPVQAEGRGTIPP